MRNKYLIESLRSKGYGGVRDYINRRSNEILFDEVWLWRLKAGVEDDFPNLNSVEVIRILKKIVCEILDKGGVMVDYSKGEAENIINEYRHVSKEIFVDKIMNFILHNPDYGSDGNGIWFE